MPHYPRYGLRWGFAFLKITIPHQLGKYWRYKPPHTPTNLLVAKPGVSGDRRGFTSSSIREFVFRLSVQVGFILSYSKQETLRLALALGALAFVYRFLHMLQHRYKTLNRDRKRRHPLHISVFRMFVYFP